MRIFKNKINFLYFFLRPVRPRGYSIVPQISQIYTDFFFYYFYPQMRPIRSDLHRFSRLHCSPLRKRFFRIPPSPFSQRELHLSPRPSLLRSEGENRPTRCSNRYAIRLADHQRSRQILRDGTARGRMGISECLNFLIWSEVLKETGSALL